MNGFEIVRTRDELHNAASRHDGMCKVVKTRHGAIVVDPDKELNGTGVSWDYYMCDEPDCFDFKKYGIAQ